MKDGFFRVAACVPKVSVGDCDTNTSNIIELATEASNKGCDLAVFPEMCITAYTCGDLFHNEALLQAAEKSIEKLMIASLSSFYVPIVVGAPIKGVNTLYNCALVIYNGAILAVIPKTYLPNYNEFYEKRWWAPAPSEAEEVMICGSKYTLATDQLVEINGVKVGCEICEDLWTPVPPSSKLAMAGAEVIANLSASDDIIGKYAYLRGLIKQQSARCICGYVYAGAGYGESSTDLVFDGKAIISENGRELAINKRWTHSNQIEIADIDIEALRHDRLHTGSYHDCAEREKCTCPVVSSVSFDLATGDQLYRKIEPLPFVPPTDDAMADRCSEILNIQMAGLAKRLEFIHCKSLVVGISGGLDSTLALLVAVGAFDKLGYDRKGILGVTMPGFGTSDRTHDNALKLMRELGISMREISIAPAVLQHFSDIGHDINVHDVTYENSQARYRTMLLMNIANQTGGIVLGTGDLSELALGWATYNGDHMSMYGVNASVPKTLVRYLVRYYADSSADADAQTTLHDIIDTPISPELIPTDNEGNITQKTEDLVGPYELHDFFLYYTLRYGFTPQRIYKLARHAFAGSYDEATIERWLKTFVRRFFQQQFKRSCLPDGPKVGSVCLSPRGDWRMPSDAVAFAVNLE